METMVAAGRTETLWAVLNRAGQVVVMFGGARAATEAQRWVDRGYRVAPLEDD